ncbi:MAG: hypothetical protein A4E51_00928 [Methanosaeta sp. PtaU1.Bin055]|nr:MAG: hypothetical protein A4E51_00928 [Methanosaeta sp. PtaU1.Bin055]
MRRGVVICIISLLLISLFVCYSSGKEGYSIEVDVNGTAWGIDRSTQNLNLNIEGKVSGFGNISRNNRIRSISGVSFSEKSSVVRGGNLSMEDRIQLVAKERPVYIQYVLGSLGATEYAKIGIDERWITQFINYKNISYLGEGGIRTSERYEDNGEHIFSYTDSWKLSKESMYVSFNNRTIILAEIYPNSIKVDRSSNKSSLYYLDMESVGALARIDLISARPSDEKVSDISEEPVSRNLQDYAGHVKTELMVSDRWVTAYPTNETDFNGDNSSSTVVLVE